MWQGVLYLLPAVIAAAAAAVIDGTFDGTPARTVERAAGQDVEAVLALGWVSAEGTVDTAAIDGVSSVVYTLAWDRRIVDEPTARGLREGDTVTVEASTGQPFASAKVTVAMGGKGGGPGLAVVRFRCTGPTRKTDTEGRPVYGPVTLPVTSVAVTMRDGSSHTLKGDAVRNLDTLLIPVGVPQAWMRLREPGA
jgi:hypothetical protein